MSNVLKFPLDNKIDKNEILRKLGGTLNRLEELNNYLQRYKDIPEFIFIAIHVKDALNRAVYEANSLED